VPNSETGDLAWLNGTAKNLLTEQLRGAVASQLLHSRPEDGDALSERSRSYEVGIVNIPAIPRGGLWRKSYFPYDHGPVGQQELPRRAWIDSSVSATQPGPLGKPFT